MIKTLYVASRVLNPVIPIRVGTCPTAILRADPVMKAEMTVKEMNSTIQPHLIKPIKMIIDPAITASAEAMTCPGMVGSLFFAAITTLPTIVDMTATGFAVSADSV